MKNGHGTRQGEAFDDSYQISTEGDENIQENYVLSQAERWKFWKEVRCSAALTAEAEIRGLEVSIIFHTILCLNFHYQFDTLFLLFTKSIVLIVHKSPLFLLFTKSIANYIVD